MFSFCGTLLCVRVVGVFFHDLALAINFECFCDQIT